MASIGTDIHFAAQWLQKAGLVAIPTETVYGLAANALDEKAVVKIFEAKKRPFFDPLIVHIARNEDMDKYGVDIPEAAYRLAETFWPGPLTLIVPRSQLIPDLVTSGQPTVGLRRPAHPLTQELLQLLPFPLAAPSANPFGYVSPTTAQHVAAQLGDVIPYILDGGPCEVGVESTIVGFDGGQAVIYRVGGLSIEEIEKITGPVQVQLNQSSNPVAPGQLKSHYAPGKPVYIGNIEELLSQHPDRKAGIISFSRRYEHPCICQQWILSPQGRLDEAARHLFAALREADSSGAELILAENFPDEGLGRAINDRLRRASA